MIDDMGIFRTRVGVAHYADADTRRELDDVMVDTGSEYNWIPAATLESLGVRAERDESFETADGRVLRRPVGFARLFVGERSGITAVVFAQPQDMVLLGAVGLETLNLRIDLARRQLVPAGPVPVAPAA